MKVLVAISCLAATLLISACGGSEETTPTGTGSTAETTQKAATTTTTEEAPPKPKPAKEVHKGSWAPLKRAAGDKADRLLLPQGPAPDKVLVRDLEIGKGRMVQRGDWVTVAYKGFDYVTGQPTLDQWLEAPFSWTYGIGELYYGLESGLKGIRVGGVRELVAPSRVTHNAGTMVIYVKLLKAERQK